MAEVTGCLLVDGRMKVGQTSIGGIDFNIPELGFSLMIGRVYDSRNTCEGGFGNGWSMPHEASNVQADFTYAPGEGWGQEERGSGLNKTYYLISYDRKLVVLRLGDGAVFTFRMDVSPKSSFMRPILAQTQLTAAYLPDEDTEGTLEALDVSLPVYLYPGGKLADEAGEEYDPKLFKLTLEDGTVYVIHKEQGIQTITDPYGHIITYTGEGISHSSGDVLRIERDTGNRIERITDQLGRTVEYHYDESGMLKQVIQKGEGPYAMKVLENYGYQKGVFEQPVLKDIIAPDGTRLGTFEYDSSGRKTGLRDHEGNRIIFGYDAPQHEYTVTDRRGNPTTYTYDGDGNVTSVIDAEGNATLYTYDADGNKLTETNALGHTTAYTYDDDRNVLSETDPLGNTTAYTYDDKGNKLSERDALGNTTTYTYDSYGKMLTETDVLGNSREYTYNADGLKTREKDPLGNVTSFAYDAQGNLTSQTDPAGNTTEYTYNHYGKRLTVKEPVGNVTTYTYDPQGNETSVTDALGNTTTYTYDALGNRSTETDALGQTTTYQYDYEGNVIQVTNALGHTTISTYDPNGNRVAGTTTLTTPDGTVDVTTQYIYDKTNRLIETIDSYGNSITTGYNAAGLRTATIDQLGRRTEYEYDPKGQLIRTQYPDGTETRTTYDAEGKMLTKTDRAGRVTNYTYDALGRRTKTTYPDGSFTQTWYDAAGRTIKVADALGNETTYTYYDAECNCTTGKRKTTVDALGNTASYEYDSNGNTIEVIDANGNSTGFEYDQKNRKIKTIFADGTFTAVEYDALGRKIAETGQAGVTTSFAYDALGRLQTVTDASGNVTHYAYNEAGNQISQTDTNDHTTRFVYDKLGRRINRILPLGMEETSEYDAAGNMITKTDFNGKTTTFVYESNNRLITKTFPDGTTERYIYTATGEIASVEDSRGITSYIYDVRDRLMTQTNPDETAMSYTYDANGNRTSVTTPSGTTVSTYDALNRLATVTDPEGGVTTYLYDAIGNRTGMIYPNRTRTGYTYDTLYRLVYLENSTEDGEIIASYRYTLNPDGSRAQVIEHTGRTVQYTYDVLKRLIEEDISESSGEDRVISYTYDAVGNRLTRDDKGVMTTYTYDDNDRLLTENDSSYTYDNNGNTLSTVNDEETLTYFYDFQNRLVRADLDKAGTTTIVEYLYDYDGIRVGEMLNGERIDYVVDKNRDYAQVIEERNDAGNLLVSYIYGDDLISQKRAGTQWYYHYDGLGSTRALTNENGNMRDTYTYEAYGTLIEREGDTTNAYLFTGEQYDPNIGFYYLRARYMNPAVGRFVTLDTFEGSQYDPFSLHKYLYAHGNPVNYTDPSGNVTLQELLINVAIIGIGASVSVGGLYLYNESLAWLYGGKGSYTIDESCFIQYSRDRRLNKIDRINRAMVRVESTINDSDCIRGQRLKKCLQKKLRRMRIKCSQSSQACGGSQRLTNQAGVITLFRPAFDDEQRDPEEYRKTIRACDPLEATILHEMVHTCKQRTNPFSGWFDPEKVPEACEESCFGWDPYGSKNPADCCD